MGSRELRERAQNLARSFLYGTMGYLGVSEMNDKAVNYVAERLHDEVLAVQPDTLRERLEGFAGKVEAAIKARDFSERWGPWNVQQSCSEMIHEQLEEYLLASAPTLASPGVGEA